MSLRDASALYTYAVRDLAILHGSPQQRIANACRNFLSNVGAQEDIPDHLWDMHASICKQVVHGVSDDVTDPFTVRFSRMGDVEAADLAWRIYDLALQLRSRCEAPPWHYVGQPVAVVRVLTEGIDRDQGMREHATRRGLDGYVTSADYLIAPT